MIFTNMDTPLHCTEIVAIELKQNSNPTNFDPLLKKFYKRPDATIHTNEIAQWGDSSVPLQVGFQ